MINDPADTAFDLAPRLRREPVLAIVRMTPVLILGLRLHVDRALEQIAAFEPVRLMPAPAVLNAVPYSSKESAPLAALHGRVQALRTLLTSHAASDRTAPPLPPKWSTQPVDAVAAWVHQITSDAERHAATVRESAAERAALTAYIEAVRAMPGTFAALRTVPDTQLVLIVVSDARRPAVAELVRALAAPIGRTPETFHVGLTGGRTATLLVLPARLPQLMRLLVASGLTHLDVSPASAAGVDDLLETLAQRSRAAADRHDAAQRALEDMTDAQLPAVESLDRELERRMHLGALRALARHTDFVFVLAAWVPTQRLGALRAALVPAVPGVVVTPMADEQATEPAPIIVRNPAWIAPYEVLLRAFPLTPQTRLDPTPFIALSFPIFLGLMVADLGYGAVVSLLGVLLRRWSRTNSHALAASAGTILVHAGVSAAVFGVLFGEVFGTSDKVPLVPLWFDRRETPFAYLALVMGLGIGHLLTGYVIGFVSALRGREGRRAIQLVAELAGAVAVALLLALKVGAVPHIVLSPALAILAVSVGLLVYAAGYRGPLELPSALVGFISYMRLFAIGLASASLAEAANHIGGLFESGLLGLLVAVLLHAFFLAIGLLSPAVQAVRLHLVEFSGRTGGHAYPAKSREDRAHR